jgi:hypothetical protein
MTMQGTCDFCDQPAIERCHATNCTKKMCDQHAQRLKDMGTQPLGTTANPYLMFYAYCPTHVDFPYNKTPQ